MKSGSSIDIEIDTAKDNIEIYSSNRKISNIKYNYRDAIRKVVPAYIDLDSIEAITYIDK